MLLNPKLKDIVDGLRDARLTIAFAESCTGGRLAADLTTVPGSSDVMVGSAVCYQVRAKQKVLGLTHVTEENVVSEETAKKMARSCRNLFGAHVGVGTTGVLDGDDPHAFFAISKPAPAGTLVSPVTWVCKASYVNFKTSSERDINREILVRAVTNALLGFVVEEAPQR